MRKQDYVWFIAPQDARTNEIIFKELQLPEHSTQQELVCKDGKKRNMWECSYEAVNKLIQSRRQLKLRFRIFNQRGRYGQIREWTFFKKRQRSP